LRARRSFEIVVTDSRNNLSTTFTEVLLGLLAGVLAVFTILTHFAQALGLGFQVYAIVGVVLTALLFILAAPFARKRLNQATNRDGKALFLVVSLGILCSTLALVSHRSDADDYYYTPNVVYSLDNPKEPMGFDVHFLDGGAGCNIVSYGWGTSGPFEYSRGAVAGILACDFLSVYYLLTPALIGFLIPFALYFALSHFSERTIVTATSVAITIGIVLLLGETHRTFGNFSLTRAYQGKTLFLAVGIPFFVGVTFCFFRSPSPYHWTLLFAVATAMAGATPSAVVVLPALASVLAIAELVAPRLQRQVRLVYHLYFASFCYVALYALFLAVNSEGITRADNPINQGWPTTFLGHLSFFVNASKPVTPLVVCVSSLAATSLTHGRQRRFLVTWIIAAVALYLNPLTAPVVMRYFASPNIYWRLFYIYPFPLVIGVTAVHLSRRLSRSARNLRFAIPVLTILFLVGAHVLPFSTSIFRYESTFSVPPRYKLPEELVNTAKAIISQAPEGTMLAPTGLSGVVPMMSSKHPQVRIRRDGVRLWLANCGRPEAAASRIGASEFVGGDRSMLPEFREFLSTEGETIRCIIMRRELTELESAQDILETYQFVNHATVGDHVIECR
jgi:hypothetical protein